MKNDVTRMYGTLSFPQEQDVDDRRRLAEAERYHGARWVACRRCHMEEVGGSLSGLAYHNATCIVARLAAALERRMP